MNVGDVAGIVTGFKAGRYSEQVARRMLRELGTGDDVIDNLLATAVGIGVGFAVGSIVDDVVDGLFGSEGWF